MEQTSSKQPLSVCWLWERLVGECLSTVDEKLRPEAAEIRDQFQQFLAHYEQMTGARFPAPEEQPPESEEWWQTAAEASAQLLDRMEQAMIATADPPPLEFYRLGVRLALLVARVEANRAEYFQEEFNDTERSLNV
ncbi:hypothetical protein ACFL5Q_04625 [Planctomycetota bacterium]